MKLQDTPAHDIIIHNISQRLSDFSLMNLFGFHYRVLSLKFHHFHIKRKLRCENNVESNEIKLKTKKRRNKKCGEKKIIKRQYNANYVRDFMTYFLLPFNFNILFTMFTTIFLSLQTLNQR